MMTRLTRAPADFSEPVPDGAGKARRLGRRFVEDRPEPKIEIAPVSSSTTAAYIEPCGALCRVFGEAVATHPGGHVRDQLVPIDGPHKIVVYTEFEAAGEAHIVLRFSDHD